MSVRRAPTTALPAPRGAPGTLTGPAIAPKLGAFKAVAPTSAPMDVTSDTGIRGGFWLEGRLDDTPSHDEIKDGLFGTGIRSMGPSDYVDGLRFYRNQFNNGHIVLTHYSYEFNGLTSGQEGDLLEFLAAMSKSEAEDWFMKTFNLPSMPVVLAGDRPRTTRITAIEDQLGEAHRAFVNAKNATRRR